MITEESEVTKSSRHRRHLEIHSRTLDGAESLGRQARGILGVSGALPPPSRAQKQTDLWFADNGFHSVGGEPRIGKGVYSQGST